MIKRFGKTETVLDRYDSFAAMHRDHGVTSPELIEIIRKAGHLKGVARAVARHGRCGEEVLAEMRKSPSWWVRCIGYFHHARAEEALERDVHLILAGRITESHGQIRMRAKDHFEETALRQAREKRSNPRNARILN